MKNSAVCWKLRVSLGTRHSIRSGSDNSRVRTISREVAETSSQTALLTPQRLHAELLETSVSGARAYLHGAAHDATISHRHRTVRFGQSDERWLEQILTSCERYSSWRALAVDGCTTRAGSEILISGGSTLLLPVAKPSQREFIRGTRGSAVCSKLGWLRATRMKI